MQICRMISMDTSTKKSAVAVFDNGTYISSQTIDLAKEKDDIIKFYTEKYQQMLAENLEQYIENFDKYTTLAKADS